MWHSHGVKRDSRGDDPQYLDELHGREVVLGPAQRLPHDHDEHAAASQAQPHFPTLHPVLRPRNGLAEKFPDYERDQHIDDLFDVIACSAAGEVKTAKQTNLTLLDEGWRWVFP